MKPRQLLPLLAVLLFALAAAPAPAIAAAPAPGFSTPARLTDPASALVDDGSRENLTGLTAVGNNLYFTAYLPATGIELWVSDGTPRQGTHLVQDIVPGVEGSYPAFLTVFGDKLLFGARRGLWISDGTPAGTRPLVPDFSSMYIDSITVAGGKAFIATANPAMNEAQLWVSDGTEAGTRPIASVWASQPFLFGDQVLFINNAASQREVWATDGTAEGTRSLGLFPAFGKPLAVFRGAFYLVDYAGDSRPKLWRSDGTPEGTAPLLASEGSSLYIEQYHLTFCSLVQPEIAVWGDKLYFRTSNGNYGGELWSSDGTEAGTRRVASFTPDGSTSPPLRLVGLPDALLFVARDIAHGYELWRSNGTEAGTSMVRDLNPGGGSSQVWTKPSPYSVSCPEYGAINAAIAVGPYLLFTGDDGVHGREPWVSDGTSAGTRPLGDLVGGPGGSMPDSFTRVGSKVVFRATDGDGKVALWAVQTQPYQQLLPLVRR